jgi:hypothetical protein
MGEKKLITFLVISSGALIVIAPCVGLSARAAPLYGVIKAIASFLNEFVC